MSMKNLCIVFGPTLMRCPVHEVGPSYVIMELFLKNVSIYHISHVSYKLFAQMESFFEDVDLSRESSESCKNYFIILDHMIHYIIVGNERLLPKQLNADKQQNVDQGFQRVTSGAQSDVKVLSSEANAAVGSIWKKNSPRNPQIHKSPSRSEDLPMPPLIDTPQTIPEGRVVNIDEAIACRYSQYTSSSNINDLSNGRPDVDHTGVGIHSSSSSLGMTSSDEHMCRTYADNSWDPSRHKYSQHERSPSDSLAERRAQSVTSPFITGLESDL